MKTLVTRTVLIAQADADLGHHPQYKGYWNDWAVGTVTRKVRTKLGVAFEKGDVVLVSPKIETNKVPVRGKSLPYAEWPTKSFAVCYSFRNKCNTQIDAKSVKLH